MSLKVMVLTGLFAALHIVGSQLSVPIGPVPHTLQIFFVLLAGVVLGGRWGGLSVVVWILLGVFGLPVFAQGKAGAAVLLGPTGGFLVGFVLCAYIVGVYAERVAAPVFGRVLAVMLVGLALVYALGLAGFMASFKYFLHKPMTLTTAFTLSVLPFLPFDIIKTALAAYVGVKVRRTLAKTAYGSLPGRD